MLISYFQNSIQGGYLIKNTEMGLFAFDISNTGQPHSGLALSLGMTWPNPAWGHSLAKRSPAHYLRYPFRLCSRAKTLLPQLLVCTNPSRTGSLQPPPPLVQQCGSFLLSIWHVCIASTCAIRFFLFFLLYHFFLWILFQQISAKQRLLFGCGSKGNSKARYIACGPWCSGTGSTSRDM